MFCVNCGNAMDEGATQCEKCGQKVGTAEEKKENLTRIITPSTENQSCVVANNEKPTKKKRTLIAVTAIIIVLLACASVWYFIIRIPDIDTINLSVSDEIQMIVGDALSLHCDIVPEKYKKRIDPIWSSSDEMTGKVIGNGYNCTLTAVGDGNCVITVNAGKSSRTIAVKVIPQVESVSIEPKELVLSIADDSVLTYTLEPQNAEGNKITWESSDSGIAEVDDTGRVTARSDGECQITITAGEKKATTNIKVLPDVESISLSKKSVSLLTGESITLACTIKPNEASVNEIVWESSDPKVATVNQKGVVTAKSDGTCIITVKAGKKTAEATVTVETIAKEIQLVMGKWVSYVVAIGDSTTYYTDISITYSKNGKLLMVVGSTTYSCTYQFVEVDTDGNYSYIIRGDLYGEMYYMTSDKQIFIVLPRSEGNLVMLLERN